MLDKVVNEDCTVNKHYGNIFNAFFNEYKSDPALWDSAFWGVAGGVTFQGLGSAFQTGKLAYNRNKAEKNNVNPTTGEEKKNSNFLSNKNNTFKFQLNFHNYII